MATFFELPVGNDFPYFVVNSSGASVPASGYKIGTFVAGTTTPLTTYTDSTGGTPNANPILLGATGLPQSGNNVVGIWVPQGSSVKATFSLPTDSFPPSSAIWTRDNLQGINDPTSNLFLNTEWVSSGLTPTFISTTSFSVTGDQRTNFQVDRRVKTTNSGGTVYSTITASSFGSGITTITVVNDSSVLDSGLSAVSYGILSSTNRSIPPINTLQDQTDPTKKLSFNLSGLPTATTKTINVSSPENICNGRLTLTTALPVTISDVTAATSVFFTPFQGNRVATYNGFFWNINTFTEKTLAVPASTSQMYDIFIVDGTLALEALAWTNDTTRATALTTQDGVLVKTGDATRRYLGSFRTTGSSGQTEDSIAKRYVWNYYNRSIRHMRSVDTTNTWSYNTASYRQANAAAANQLDFVCGVSENPVFANVMGQIQVAFGATSSGMTLGGTGIGVGVNVTNSNSAQIMSFGGYNINATTPAGSFNQSIRAEYTAFPAVGRTFLAWIEIGDGATTTTWYGDNGGTVGQSGISGQIIG